MDISDVTPTASNIVRPTSASPDATDGEACLYLQREIAPTLARDHATKLAATVRSAASPGNLGRLSRLPERQRRQLLETIEAQLAGNRRGPPPRALVRLTNIIATPPAADARLLRWLASPAR
ncbi:MAG: hypothetical protein L3J91_05235 [Thermoplasmata archaeon]|nr:hypothetical protein [Thermoplasmata archaeon]